MALTVPGITTRLIYLLAVTVSPDTAMESGRAKKKKKIQTCKPELLWRSIVTDEFEMQNLSIQHTWLDDERYKQKQQPEAASSSLSLGSHWQSTKKNKNEPLINFEYCQ